MKTALEKYRKELESIKEAGTWKGERIITTPQRSRIDTTAAKQLESLETALSRSIAQCYSVEGMYPPSLKYLEEHYGLTYDRGKFLIDYQSVGANLMPEVTILSIQ